MRETLIIIFFMSCISSVMAAEITVKPFEMTFEVNQEEYDIDFTLKLQCRYEKFVISDSAEYEYKYKDVPLKISRNNNTVTLSLSSEQHLEQDEWYRSNKSCGYIQHFYLISKKYSVGWASQFDRAIKLGMYEHSRMLEKSEYPVEELRDLIANKLLNFTFFNPVHNQISIKFTIDGTPMSGYSNSHYTTALMDPETQMPYLLNR